MPKLWLWSLISMIVIAGSMRSVTAQDTQALALNETVTGTVEGSSTVNYSVEILRSQDVLIVYESGGTILVDHNVTAITPTETIVEYDTEMGGGGGDSPTFRTILIPGFAPADSAANTTDDERRVIDIRVIRPLNSPAEYALTVYTLDPPVISATEPLSVQPEDHLPVQVFAINAALRQPFTVQAQVDDAPATYLWNANIPEYWLPEEEITASDIRLVDPYSIDFASRPDAETGIIAMQLFYSGQDVFHLVIRAQAPYTLNFTSLSYEMMAQGAPLTVTVSPQMPLRLLRFTAAEASQVVFNARVLDGVGARLRAREDSPIPDLDLTGEFLSLGETGRNNTVEALEGRLLIPINGEGQITVIVQVPGGFSGEPVVTDPVTLMVMWNAALSGS